MIKKYNSFFQILFENEVHDPRRRDNRAVGSSLPLKICLNGKNCHSRSFKSIRCQFHQRFTCTFFVQKCFAQLFSSYMHVTKEKLPKRLLYKKGASKMLMKFTLGVNFINILQSSIYFVLKQKCQTQMFVRATQIL